jgi:hypothetical protein
VVRPRVAVVVRGTNDGASVCGDVAAGPRIRSAAVRWAGNAALTNLIVDAVEQER